MFSHHLSELSPLERDALLASIIFVDKPQKFAFPDSVPFISGQYIINYSLCYDAIEKQRGEGHPYVVPSNLRNGDVLQFGTSRECTSYCIWLGKDLSQNLTNKMKVVLKELDGKDLTHVEVIVSSDIEIVRPPTDVEPIPLHSREQNGPHNDPHYHCYLFCNLDKYGFVGTTATSMGSERYFQAVKGPAASSVLLDPLLVHSQSYYGKLIQHLKDSNPTLTTNPYFPYEYVTNGAVNAPNNNPIQHAMTMTWIPIDLAQNEYVTGKCSSCSPNNIHKHHSSNAFWEIRNIFYRHYCLFLAQDKEKVVVPAVLPVIDPDFDRLDRVTIFYMKHTTTISFHDTSKYAQKPYLGALSADSLYAIDKARYDKIDEEEQQPQPQPQLPRSLYDEMLDNQRLWIAANEEQKKEYMERADRDRQFVQIANEEISMYQLYAKEMRPMFYERYPQVTWCALETALVASWCTSEASMKRDYRDSVTKKEQHLQLVKDAHDIVRYLEMQYTAKKIPSKKKPKIAAAAESIASVLSKHHHTTPVETVATDVDAEVDVDKAAAVVLIPSEVHFMGLMGLKSYSMPGAESTRRAPSGYIAFTMAKKEPALKAAALTAAALTAAESSSSSRYMDTDDTVFYEETATEWLSLSESDRAQWISNEQDMELKGGATKLKTNRGKPKKTTAYSSAQFGFGFGFGANTTTAGTTSVGVGAGLGFGAFSALQPLQPLQSSLQPLQSLYSSDMTGFAFRPSIPFGFPTVTDPTATKNNTNESTDNKHQ